MSESTIGWLTIRIPVIATTESESPEIPAEYTYLSAGTATLVEHNVPASWWENLGFDIVESGISLEQLTDAVLSAAKESEPEPEPKPVPKGNLSELIRTLEAEVPGIAEVVAPADDVDVQAAARIAEAADQNAYFDGTTLPGKDPAWFGTAGTPGAERKPAEPVDGDDDVLFNDDGYPTDGALRRIELFQGTPADLIEYLKTVWWSDLITVEEALNHWGSPITRLTLTTGGWSGNEDVMTALTNTMFQTLFWAESWRGGRSVYEIQAELINTPAFLGKFSELPADTEQ